MFSLPVEEGPHDPAATGISQLTLMDALEARVVALEEVAAARGLRRLAAARRLGRSLRASIRHFSGDTFAERRCDAASTEL